MGSRKNEQVINAVAQLLTKMAAFDKGMTAFQVMEALSISKATAYRILNNEPGFVKALNPLYPTSYYYSAEQAAVDIRRRALAQAKEVGRYGSFEIKTHLGVARYANLTETAKLAENNPTQILDFANTVIGLLSDVSNIDPSAPDFVSDLDKQIRWFDAISKASAACRAYYELTRDLFEREEMQMPDFWELFLKVR